MHFLSKKLASWKSNLSSIQIPKDRWNYRGKVCLSTEWNGFEWHFGLRIRDETVPTHDCPVHSETVRAIIRILSNALPPAEVFPMHYLALSGAQVTIVLKTRSLPECEWHSLETQNRLRDIGIEGVWIHLNPSTGRKVFAKRDWILCMGHPESKDSYGLWYGPLSFQQVSPKLYHQALNEVISFLSPGSKDDVIDLYSGNGATLLEWTKRRARSIAVEIGEEACRLASKNAPNSTVLRGLCEQRIPQLRAWSREFDNRRKLMFVNPPRKGLEAEVVDWIIKEYRPERLAYLSCSAGSLARDLQAFSSRGFQVCELIPYDFFPNTYHVEILAKLSNIRN